MYDYIQILVHLLQLSLHFPLEEEVTFKIGKINNITVNSILNNALPP